MISKRDHILKRYVNKIYEFDGVYTTITDIQFCSSFIIISYEQVDVGFFLARYSSYDIANQKSILRMRRELKVYYQLGILNIDFHRVYKSDSKPKTYDTSW